MKEKRKAASWYIAATHYLTALVAVPFPFGILMAFVIMPLLASFPVLLIRVVQLLVLIFAIWLGVMYSARYIKKNYIIKDKVSVIQSATMYLVVLHLGYVVIQFSTGNIAEADLIYSIVRIVIIVPLFYFWSKKYIDIDVTATVSPPQTPAPERF